MKTSLEAWADSFHFSEDLETLEAAYQKQHQDDLKAQAQQQAQAQPSTAEAAPPSEDEKFLEQLAHKIAGRLAENLSIPEVMAPFLRLNELERDNATMAAQIETLLKTLQQKQAEIDSLQARQGEYHPLIGSFYYKVS